MDSNDHVDAAELDELFVMISQAVLGCAPAGSGSDFRDVGRSNTRVDTFSVVGHSLRAYPCPMYNVRNKSTALVYMYTSDRKSLAYLGKLSSTYRFVHCLTLNISLCTCTLDCVRIRINLTHRLCDANSCIMASGRARPMFGRAMVCNDRVWSWLMIPTVLSSRHQTASLVDLRRSRHLPVAMP